MTSLECPYLQECREDPDYCLFFERACPCALDPMNLFYMAPENCSVYVVEEKERAMPCKYLEMTEGQGEICRMTGKVCVEFLDPKSPDYIEICKDRKDNNG